MIDEEWNQSEHLKSLWEDYQVTPGQLWEMTPKELFFLFGRRIGARDESVNPVEELAATNRRREAKGMEPVAPMWVMKEVPRARSNRMAARDIRKRGGGHTGGGPAHGGRGPKPGKPD